MPAHHRRTSPSQSGRFPTSRSSHRYGQRRGIALFWVLAATPVLLVLFLVITALESIWLARAELQNCVEAAALAGAKLWGDNPDLAANRSNAHLAAQALFQANTIFGNLVPINSNDDPGATNNNQVVPGPILLGQLAGGTFYPNQSPTSVNQRSCRVSTSATITPLMRGLGVLGPYTVQATATAYYNGSSEGAGTPQLVRVTVVSP